MTAPSSFAGIDMDKFTLPDGYVSIAFSGGRTSAMMLRLILEANGPLDPRRAIVLFQNTGREMPETLDFVQECSERWSVPIVWLEYRPQLPRFEVVNHNSASRNGEPFAALIEKRRMLPNRIARFCTSELKVHAASRYARSIGFSETRRALGIRADEPKRIRYNNCEKWRPWYPLADAGLSKGDVRSFWSAQPFDLRLSNIGGKTPLGNCDGCFLKSEANLAALWRDYPERAKWWSDQEDGLAKAVGKHTGTFFNHRRPMRQLGEFVKAQADWVFDVEGGLCQTDDGDCTG